MAGLHEAPSKGDGARDLQDLLWSSIDNATSKDLDQIEVAEELPDKGIVLRVGIADVDALVPKGSAIDAHAFANATSVYTGVHVYPMLPEELSTGLTSLNEASERLVLVIEVELAPDGSRAASRRLPRASRRTARSSSYEEVGAWLEGRGPEPQKSVENDALEEQLWLQDRAAQAAQARARAGGRARARDDRSDAGGEGRQGQSTSPSRGRTARAT